MSSELRRDPTTDDWVVLAPDRARRPQESTVRDPTTCRFCPGQENPRDREVWRLNGPDTWRVRVLENLYPVLSPDAVGPTVLDDALASRRPGRGRHEVLVEHPRHDWDFARADVTELRDVLVGYRQRYRALRATDVQSITVFRNHGKGAGTSLEHPHSQIIAAPIVPPLTRRRLAVARRRYEELGRCPYLELADREIAERDRLLTVTEHVVAFEPFAAGSPYETWILPRFHESSFGTTSDTTLDELAAVLRAVCGALAAVLGDPDYNMVVHSAPPAEEHQEHFLWHLRIIPRMTTPAGFELATGLSVNPVPPERAAQRLRPALP